MKKFYKILLSLLLLTTVSAPIWAGAGYVRSWTVGSHTDVSWDQKLGLVYIDVMYFDDNASAILSYNGGFSRDDGGELKVEFIDTELKVTCKWEGDSPEVTKSRGNEQYSWQNLKDGEQRWLRIVWKPKQTTLNNGVNIKFSGLWWMHGATPDEKVDGSRNITPSWSRTDFNVALPSDLDRIYTNEKGEPVVKIPWSRPDASGSANSLGSIVLCDEKGNPIQVDGVTSFNGSAKSGSFILNANTVKALNMNSATNYTIVQTYVPTSNSSLKYVTQSRPFKILAYPQIKDFTVQFDASKKELALKWKLTSAPGADCVNDDFIIYHSVKKALDQSSTEMNPILVAFVGGVPEYNYTISVDEGTDAIYSFRVHRSTTSQNSAWNVFDKKVDNVAVNTVHAKPVKVGVEMSKDQKTATVSWAMDVNATWSKGSKLSIIRQNETTGTSDEIFLLTKWEEVAGLGGNMTEYVDNTIRLCNQYKYKIQVVPNETYSSIPPLYTESIEPIEIGSVADLQISKGYYSDRVELSWKTIGGFDDYAVERKVADTPDSEYKQLLTVKGSAATVLYTANDNTCLPGVVYSYRVKGLLSCNNEVKESNTLEDIGFRTPTGDIYGRVTFENGQAEEGVEVFLETLDVIPGKSFSPNGQGAEIDNAELLATNADKATLQAWVAPTSATAGSDQKIIAKEGMYELGLSSAGYIYFKAGTDQVVSAKTVASIMTQSKFFHVTGVNRGDSLFIYLNGAVEAKAKLTNAVSGNSNKVQIGAGYNGLIDEIRIWGSALTEKEILRDYTRYLTGGEPALKAYYSFNYGAGKYFYDTSFDGLKHNANHGQINAASSYSDVIPATSQLGYRGVTTEDGAYSIRGIPFVGNGTAYTLIPKNGIHQFKPAKEDRFIGANATSHTVNFTDMSTFLVTGKVIYRGGTYPVEGVQFRIDGVPVLQKNGTAVQTNADGEFSFRVPVGTHEVKMEKNGHKFMYDGRICDQYGLDLNYQDEVRELVLEDTTTIRYVGRVAGGMVQEAFPYGHSLSKNNLSDKISIRLKHTKGGYKLVSEEETREVAHFLPSNKKEDERKSNEVSYSAEYITVTPNLETGEFVADVLPISYTTEVLVEGHEEMPGSSSLVDMSSYLVTQISPRAYEDSVKLNNVMVAKTYNDTVRYHFAQQFIKRYKPEVRIRQLDKQGKPVEFFGVDSMMTTTIFGKTYLAPLYKRDTKKYTFEMPVFAQNEKYEFDVDMFEAYRFYETVTNSYTEQDEVPVKDAKISFNNGLATKNQQTGVVVQTDSLGKATYAFQGGDPELSTATAAFTATATYGTSDNPTSINWDPPFENGKALLTGMTMTGTDFVTAGPDQLLMVLRDPPGSNSYAYLEKGSSLDISSTYTGVVRNEGTEDIGTGIETAIMQITTVNTPASATGTGSLTVETSSGFVMGVEHEEEYEGSDTKRSKVVTTTRFQTSEDPEYVGSDGDLYIGCGTNISFGKTQNVTIVPRSGYDEAIVSGLEIKKVYAMNEDWVLIQKDGINASTSFSTLFAYPQVHIEGTLIPNLYELRDSKLILPGEATKEELEQRVEGDPTKQFYLSVHGKDHPNYAGKEGKDYFHIINKKHTEGVIDTIEFLNESIRRWEEHMSKNEEEKVKATVLQNYSFHGAGTIEYSEEYSTVLAHESTFHITVGLSYSNEFDNTIFGAKTNLELKESIITTQGGTFTSEAERSHAKGFVLAESGSDYISVDVCRVAGWKSSDEEYDGEGNGGQVTEGDLKEKNQYSPFIFRTRGGMTSCPYEGEYKTKYYQEGAHTINQATMQVEVPYITVEKNFIENVPSGETAKFVLYLRNNSQVNEDVYYDLRLVDSSNPNGAKLHIDGAAIGNGRSFLVPAGNTLVKTLEVGKGTVLNYDDLRLELVSQCQNDPTSFHPVISDTVSISAHFIPSCSSIEVKKPFDNWTYNTELPTTLVNGLNKHYLDVILSGFDVNYDDFERIEIQYKSSSRSDNEWITLNSYYTDAAKYEQALTNGVNAEMIKSSDAGKINYRLLLDDLPDQNYDLRSITVCNINNVEVENYSEVATGIKDMYNPRLFGAAQPANGVLTVNDEIRLNFNEPIAQGLMTKNNFQVTGVRNGAITDHSTSIRLDGLTSYMNSEFNRNLTGKNITFEGWINADDIHDAIIFAHGDNDNSLELAITADKRLKVKVGEQEFTSQATIPFDKGSWAHVALVYEADGHVSALYNYNEYITRAITGSYTGVGPFVLGRGINQEGFFAGKMHTVRIWDTVRTMGELQLNSLSQLSGTETNLIAYYPMKEGKDTFTEDKARGANLVMNNCEWALPEGYAAEFAGSSYLSLPTDAAVVTANMDYAMEFWFKTNGGQRNAVMVSNGSGDATEAGNSGNSFTLGFDDAGRLTYTNRGIKHVIDGDYTDSNWHHFVLTVSRTTGFAQVYMNGELMNFFDAEQLGGVVGANLFLGAKAWYPEATPAVLSVDNHFAGKIDEFRLWSLHKTQSIIEAFSNEKLNGDEMGLLAYYPFEKYITHQGIQQLEKSLDDHKKVDDPSALTKVAAPVGSVELVKDKAPVKDKGPVSNLSFEFVVNNDALIITLTEAPAKIEKSIVRLTAMDIFDKNGNRILSPISWSAYINCNQLIWGEKNINIEKMVYEPHEFTVNIVNEGGMVENYTINNQPSWLDITPVKGSVDPLASKGVTFTISEGLNIGTYNEVVHLTNSTGVSEALDMTITVKGVEPDWKVNPADFQYNMSVYGKMRFNNVFSADKRDKMAAFHKGKCVGVANSVYSKELDMWYVMLTVYGNLLKYDQLSFRMWDASTGVTYEAIPSENILFKNDAVYGTPRNPIEFNGRTIMFQTVSLEKGWNWLSYNLQNSDLANVNSTLYQGSWSKDDIVKSAKAFDSYSAVAGMWMGSLSKNGGFNTNEMFWMKVAEGQTLTVSGTAINPLTTPLTIAPGVWTPISYLPMSNLPVKTALAGYDAVEGDVVKSKDGFAMFYRNNWIGSLSYMEVNKGYMLRNTSVESKTLIYPSAASVSKQASMPVRRAAAADSYSSNMGIIAACESIGDGDELFAFINGEQRGVNTPIEVAGNTLQFITIAGDDTPMNETIQFVLRKGDGQTQVSNTSIDFRNNALEGTVDAPLLLNFNSENSASGIFPALFTNQITVQTRASQDAEMYVKMTDMSGKVVAVTALKEVRQGNQFKEVLNTQAIVAGVYLVTIYENGVPTIHKAIKNIN